MKRFSHHRSSAFGVKFRLTIIGTAKYMVGCKQFTIFQQRFATMSEKKQSNSTATFEWPFSFKALQEGQLLQR